MDTYNATVYINCIKYKYYYYYYYHHHYYNYYNYTMVNLLSAHIYILWRIYIYMYFIIKDSTN
jgi:hypothetical protein